MRIELPYPPTLNSCYPTNRSGRRTLSTKGREFRVEVQARILEQHGIINTLKGLIKVTLMLVPPDKRRRDLDNVIKPVLDGLVHAGVMEDDVQVKAIYAEMAEPRKSGSCTVLIEEL